MKTTFLILLTALFIAGCNTQNDSMMTNQSEQTFSMYPADNQTEVSVSDVIILSFSKKMDREVVEKNFHLMNKQALIDSLCPNRGTMQNHGTMEMVMNNSAMMTHLDSVHSISGSFFWSSDSTKCTFKPDFLMAPGTKYMVHLNTPMVEMMEQRMGEMGMMGRQGMSGMKDMMFHFTTKNSGSSGDHSTHHP